MAPRVRPTEGSRSITTARGGPGDLPNITISLLGTVQIAVDGRPVIDGRQELLKLLLAYLASEPGRAHRRETLCDLFWPHMESAAAKHSLRQYLYLLKKLLGNCDDQNAALITDRYSVRFEIGKDIQVDIHRFLAALPCDPSGDHCGQCLEQTEAAVALYSGDFMEEFEVAAELTELESWLHNQRQHCLNHYLVLLERLALCYEQQGNRGKALYFARRWTALDRWNERGHRTLIELLAANNEKAAALRHYDNLCTSLQQELDAEPEPETRALAEKLRRGNDIQHRLPSAQARVMQSARKFVTMLCVEFDFFNTDDPELAESQTGSVRDAVGTIVSEYGGWFSASPTGSLFAYFGYPQAQEKAAVMAAGAAQAIAETLRGGGLPQLAWRMGMHSGTIVAGAGDSYPFPDRAGLVPAAAARLAGLATSRTTLVSATSLELLGGRARHQRQGSVALPGAVHPVEVHRLDAIDITLDRIATDNARLTPLVGREKDLRRLLEYWSAAAEGVPQAVLIRGDPGIGKSRLVSTLCNDIPREQADMFVVHCYEQGEGSAFLPLRRMLLDRTRAAYGGADAEHLTAWLQEQGIGARKARQVAAYVLDMDGEMTSAADQARIAFVSAWMQLLKTWSDAKPILLVFEDVHWIDPSSAELLGQLLRQPLRFKRIMLLFSARNTHRIPQLESSAAVLDLAPLSRIDALNLLKRIAGDLDPERLEMVLRAGDGIPLFLEELVRMLADATDSGDLHAGVPSTMRELLEARIDRVGPPKSTAQIAAVIGRNFSLEHLASLIDFAPDTLHHHLQLLQQSDLVHAVDQRRDEFRFKHALIREAAYDSMLRSQREEVHRRYAEQLIQKRLARHQPEVVAFHLSATNDRPAAIPYWIAAGEAAMRRFACHEAIDHCREGLAIAAEHPAETRARQILALQLTLGAALMATQGYGSAEAHEIFKQAVELAESVDAQSELFRALNGVWRGSSSYLGLRKGREVALRALDVARHHGNQRHLVRAHVMLGITDFHLGDHAAARLYLDQAVAMYDNATELHVWDSIEDPKITALAFQSWNLWMLGEREAALSTSLAALAWAKQLEHIGSICFALQCAVILHRFDRDPVAVRQYTAELRELAEEYNLMYWIGNANAFDGWARCMLGDPSGLEPLENSARVMATVMPGQAPQYQSALADVYLMMGRCDEAVEQIQNALKINMRSEDRSLEPELRRLLGEAKCAMGDMTSGIAELRHAAKIAAHQSPAWAERIGASMRKKVTEKR